VIYERIPLHLAVDKGNLEMVNFLLANGSLVNERDLGNQTPLGIAIGKNLQNIIPILMNNGATE